MVLTSQPQANDEVHLINSSEDLIASQPLRPARMPQGILTTARGSAMMRTYSISRSFCMATPQHVLSQGSLLV